MPLASHMRTIRLTYRHTWHANAHWYHCPCQPSHLRFTAWILVVVYPWNCLTVTHAHICVRKSYKTEGRKVKQQTGRDAINLVRIFMVKSSMWVQTTFTYQLSCEQKNSPSFTTSCSTSCESWHCFVSSRWPTTAYQTNRAHFQPKLYFLPYLNLVVLVEKPNSVNLSVMLHYVM